jgi:hypothetical protein
MCARNVSIHLRFNILSTYTRTFLVVLLMLVALASNAWAATFTMGFPPPGGVTFTSSDPTGGASGNTNGETYFFSGFNPTAYGQLYWGENSVANVFEGASTGNMVFQGYNSGTGLATWVSATNWSFTSGNSPGCCSTGTQLVVQLQPFTGTSAGFLTSGFVSPTTTKGALGISGNPNEPLFQIVGGQSFQANFEFATWDGNATDAGNLSLATPIFVFNTNNNGGAGVNTSVDFEFWSTAAQPAQTVEVGGCLSNLKNFATIGAAIGTAPPKSTVEVCPGSYPEQLTISQPLTLKGVISGNAGAAVITGNGALAQNGTTTDFGPVAAQILVQNTTGVTISNLTVDGSAQPGCVAGSQVAGIAYSNVGTTGTAAGTITGVTVRNEIAGCNSAGILSDNAFIKIVSNNVQGTDGIGIAVGAGDNSITSNTIAGFAEGISTQQVNTPTVISANTLLDVTGIGINMTGSNGLQVINNIVGMTAAGQDAISVGAGNQATTVTGNKVFGGANGVVMNGAMTSTIKTNIIGAVSGNAFVFSSSGGNNKVTQNTVNEASCGISKGGIGVGDVYSPNTLQNVTSITCP